MDLSIIIVSWNVRDRLKRNLSALYKSHNGFELEVFVVDNASADGSPAMVKQEFPRVKLIANERNLGFAKANNQAIKYAQGRYILLLNPDMKVFPDTLANVIGWMDNHQEAAIAGCHLIGEDGKTVKHVRRFPTVSDQLAIVLKLPHLFPMVLNKYLYDDFDYGKDSEVDSIRGSFFMIRRETIEKIGMLDERYFLWFEEVDYCQRARQAGLKVFYTPVAECFDAVGASFSQLSRNRTQKYFRSSQLKYFKKWQPAWQYYLLKVAWPFGILIATISRMAGIKSRSKT